MSYNQKIEVYERIINRLINAIEAINDTKMSIFSRLQVLKILETIRDDEI